MFMKRDYFGLEFKLCLVIVLFPISCWVCGVATRFMEGKLLAGVLRLFLGFNILWILDVVFMLKYHKIFRLYLL